MKKLARVVSLLALTIAQAVPAADFRMDPADSRLAFVTTFETAPTPGVFKDFDVRASFDPQAPAGGRLDVTIKVASADMASADINKAIAGVEWFDFGGHQQADFHATDITRTTDSQVNSFVARGTLVLKGVQQAVAVPFTWTAAGDGATMDGEFVLKRAAFGIGTGEWVSTDVIGPDVTIKFHVRLRKAG